MSTYREERRKDKAAEAEQARADRIAAAEVETMRQAAWAEANRAATEAEQAQRRAARQESHEATQRRRAARAAKLAALRNWAGEHVVDLLIYPLALVSAIMAVPAMAVYGHQLYGMTVGLALPLLSELGMWAFALAVQVSRARTPERPVWALQLGVWLFASVNFALNLLHGLDKGWSAGVAMGLVSVAGVVAHQLTVAGARRTSQERAEARLRRKAERKVGRIRRAAIRQAVADITEDGGARLVFTPGRFVLQPRTRPKNLRVRRPLVAAIVPSPPADRADVAGIDWDGDLARLLSTTNTETVGSTPDPDDTPSLDGGGVGTLDQPRDLHESTPNQPRRAHRVPAPSTRTVEQLRAEFQAAVEAGRLDPTSAQSIRKTLRCAAKTARQLRDEYKREQ
ncbi:hypothetical protein ABZ639_27035 [Saccharomonospora sp. NPDC006951]